MRRRAVLVCLAAGGRTLGAYRGKIRIVYSEWCKIRSRGLGESGGWLKNGPFSKFYLRNSVGGGRGPWN